MFRFAIGVIFFSPLLAMANDMSVVSSPIWKQTWQTAPVQVQKYSLGVSDYQHEIKRFSFARPLTRYLSLSAQVITSRRGLQDCANSFDQATLGYEIIPRLQLAEEFELGLGYARLDGGHMAFITGDRLDMADSHSFILSTELMQGQPASSLEVRLTRTHYDAHAVYDQQTAFTDNNVSLSYQIRF
ncbi:hypothetical protein [Lacimicrobium alkaliphilum]|uniref:Outer membrane protein beta-barrel domain-containing protein n=1 Tax=Lacimicrobium alkaliphilum TaxID=1526571 RepID=A0A0U2Z4B6_9ALTE|nr:hypothetical protein [Lacimicrobium alkaliphilum]ALS97300.1 hypothetical protein AT746_02775 [Lacimicrobium alkaliphilum]